MELLQALNELRKAISIKEGPFSTPGSAWDQQMQQCLKGSASMDDATQLIGELRSNSKQWARPKQKESTATQEYSKDWSKEHQV